MIAWHASANLGWFGPLSTMELSPSHSKCDLKMILSYYQYADSRFFNAEMLVLEDMVNASDPFCALSLKTYGLPCAWSPIFSVLKDSLGWQEQDGCSGYSPGRIVSRWWYLSQPKLTDRQLTVSPFPTGTGGPPEVHPDASPNFGPFIRASGFLFETRTWHGWTFLRVTCAFGVKDLKAA